MSGSAVGQSLFTGIPSNVLVPGFYFSITPAVDTSISGIRAALLIGQANSAVSLANTVGLGTPVLATDVITVATTYGLGSVVSQMYNKIRSADDETTYYILALPENPAGTHGTVACDFAGTATAAGTLNAYVCGNLTQAAVNLGDTATAVGQNFANAVNANYYLPCTASAVGAVVTLTAKGAGFVAGDIDVRLNYNGPVAGEYTPPGITMTTVTTAGTGDPDPTSALANLPSQPYDAIVTPYSQGTSIADYNTLLNATTGRWSYIQQLFGFVFTARKDTITNLNAFGLSENSQYISVLGITGSPTTVYETAAAYGGACTASLSQDVALPLQNIALNILAPTLANQFNFQEANTLLTNGIATSFVNEGNQVVLTRAVTTYQYNLQGIADQSYKDTETMFTLSYVIRSFASDFSQKFARKKLVDNNTRIPQGSNFVNANIILAEAIALYTQLNADGYTQNVATFASNAIAQQQPGGRVALFAPIDLTNQLRTIAVAFVFSKS